MPKKGNIPWNKGLTKQTDKRLHYERPTKIQKGQRLSPKTEFKKGQKPWIASQKGFFAGSNNPAWKGGRVLQNGYIYIHSPNHPNHDNKNYVQEHRLIAEKYLNRYLEKFEVIHHINRNRQDNRPENLYLFTKRKHDKFHLSKNKPNLISNLLF